MSCPQTARRSDCATVAVRSGRYPRRCFVARPSSGSSAKRRRNSEWSSSSASAQRSFSAAATDSDRIVTVPSGDCHARATAPQQRAVTRPSCTRRVASPASRAESASEYGPRGRTTISATSASLLPRLDTAARASCGRCDRDLPSPRWRDLDSRRPPHRPGARRGRRRPVRARAPPPGRRDPRRPGADAGRPQPGRDAGQHTLDGLPPRLDRHDPPADLVHERAQDEADAPVPRDRFALRLPGRPPDQPRARRQSDRPAQPVAGALPRAAEVDQIENELNGEVCSGQLTLAQAQEREDTLKHTQG